MPPAPKGERHCSVCGCWAEDRCMDKNGKLCFWIYVDLCSHCAGRKVVEDRKGKRR